MPQLPPPDAIDPDGTEANADFPADLDPLGSTSDGGPSARPVRRWGMRFSDKLSMGTFSVATVSAYLLWTVIQTVDDLRIQTRHIADMQTTLSATLERVQTAERDLEARWAAHEIHEGARFGDYEGRLGALRRSVEDLDRGQRDNAQRLRIIESEGAVPRRPGR